MAVLGHKSTLRLAIFRTVLCVMELWDLAGPRRRVEVTRLVR